MRIFSHFHDYYDTAIGYGIDPKISYVRNRIYYTKKSEQARLLIDFFNKKLVFRYGFDFSRHFNFCMKPSSKISFPATGVVLFCGKIYPFINLKIHERTTREKGSYCYNTEHVIKFFGENKVRIPTEKRSRFKWIRPLLEDLKNFYGKAKYYKFDDIVELHFKIDSPVILISDSDQPKEPTEYQANPILREVEFFKVFDSFGAFQELSMFIGGIMGGKMPRMVEISDADRLAMHGFDEWSFRKKVR